MLRGEIWWADLGPAIGSRPARRRPVVIVSADRYNRGRIATVVVAILTSNTRLAVMPGNVFVPAASSGLPLDSVVNVTQLLTLDKQELTDRTGVLGSELLAEVDRGLRRVLQL